MALQDLSFKERHWHSQCFLCFKCSRSLVDRPFATKDDMLMCVECYSNEYSAKCHACMKTIMPGRAAQKHCTNAAKTVHEALKVFLAGLCRSEFLH